VYAVNRDRLYPHIPIFGIIFIINEGTLLGSKKEEEECVRPFKNLVGVG